MTPSADGLQIGWGRADLTPDKPVLICGQFHARVSEGVSDPIFATALAIESIENGRSIEQAVMVSCDYVSVADPLREGVRSRLQQDLPDLDASKVFFNATHTHTGPEIRGFELTQTGGDTVAGRCGIELDAMEPADYVDFAVERIAAAIADAWNSRKPGGVSFGLGQAVVGHNRRVSYLDGSSAMYGNTDDPNFSHIEGYEDHSVNLLCTWGRDGSLTGMAVNVACTSQVSEHEYKISADYWHEVRGEIARRFGEDVFVLPQCSAAGDQSPHLQIYKQAEERMRNLAGRTLRQEIATRIADAVESVLPFIKNHVETSPAMMHTAEIVDVERASISDAEVDEAEAGAANARAEYERLKKEIEADESIRSKPRWYVPITRAYRRAQWFGGVAIRKKLKETEPTLPVEVHVVRLGDVAFATNPFEYYLDFGCQIKARSKAVQTFVVQLAGSGTYVPTKRAVAGRSYGAVPASTPVGHEGGLQLSQRTVELINSLWT